MFSLAYNFSQCSLLGPILLSFDLREFHFRCSLINLNLVKTNDPKTVLLCKIKQSQHLLRPSKPSLIVLCECVLILSDIQPTRLLIYSWSATMTLSPILMFSRLFPSHKTSLTWSQNSAIHPNNGPITLIYDFITERMHCYVSGCRDLCR